MDRVVYNHSFIAELIKKCACCASEAKVTSGSSLDAVNHRPKQNTVQSPRNKQQRPLIRPSLNKRGQKFSHLCGNKDGVSANGDGDCKLNGFDILYISCGVYFQNLLGGVSLGRFFADVMCASPQESCCCAL